MIVYVAYGWKLFTPPLKATQGEDKGCSVYSRGFFTSDPVDIYVFFVNFGENIDTDIVLLDFVILSFKWNNFIFFGA